MAIGIVRLTDPRDGKVWYCAWSTGCDEPASPAMNWDEVKTYANQELRNLNHQLQMVDGSNQPESVAEIKAQVEFQKGVIARRLQRLRAKGTTWLDEPRTGEEYVRFNRCGPKGGSVNLTTLLDIIVGDRNPQPATQNAGGLP